MSVLQNAPSHSFRKVSTSQVAPFKFSLPETETVYTSPSSHADLLGWLKSII